MRNVCKHKKLDISLLYNDKTKKIELFVCNNENNRKNMPKNKLFFGIYFANNINRS